MCDRLILYGNTPYIAWEENMPTVTKQRATKAARETRERIDVRLRREQKEFIEKAAHIKGLTVTNFIIQNAVENAQRTIRDYEVWTLELPDAQLFADALAAPATLGPRLADAARRYKEEFLER
jgi:uncharacterized protein (DUF1778 family)